MWTVFGHFDPLPLGKTILLNKDLCSNMGIRLTPSPSIHTSFMDDPSVCAPPPQKPTQDKKMTHSISIFLFCLVLFRKRLFNYFLSSF